jgi:CubicO group peptidase (beta-lactamase class C family)
MGTPLTVNRASLGAWKRLAARLYRVATHPPHLRAWWCIHRYEGAWTDPGAPYYGGLQMDLGFQRTYGAALLARKGTADHWTPLEQMWVAERALRAGRGFWPWPNSARLCGLL